MDQLNERIKVDRAITPVSSADVTSRYFDMSRYARIMFVVLVGALTAVQTCVFKLKKAKDAAGTDAADIAGYTATISNTTADKIAGATEAKITAATAVAGNTVKINGLTYTAIANGATPAAYQFSVGADNTECAANLAAAINDPDSGVPGVTASANAAVVTLTTDDPAKVTLAIEGTASTLVPAIISAIGFIEVDGSALGDEYTHVAVNIVNTNATFCGAVAIRGDSRYPIVQAVGASFAKTALAD